MSQLILGTTRARQLYAPKISDVNRGFVLKDGSLSGEEAVKPALVGVIKYNAEGDVTSIVTTRYDCRSRPLGTRNKTRITLAGIRFKIGKQVTSRTANPLAPPESWTVVRQAIRLQDPIAQLFAATP